MRKKTILLFACLLLNSCFESKKETQIPVFEDIEITHHNYYEIEAFEISWSKMFDIKNDQYFVYFYSTTCSHCAEIKDWIIEKAIERKNIYFVNSSENDIIKKDISLTIGAKNCEQMAILGYPSLIEISFGIVKNNCAGKTSIKNLLN